MKYMNKTFNSFAIGCAKAAKSFDGISKEFDRLGEWFERERAKYPDWDRRTPFLEWVLEHEKRSRNE